MGSALLKVIRHRLPVPLLFGTSLLLPACQGPLSTLDPAGPAANMVAWLWWGMFAFSVLIMLFITALWCVAVRRPADATEVEGKGGKPHANRWLIGGGLVLPVASISLLLLFGIPIGHRMLPLPPEQGSALRVDVVGHQWWWEVSYPASDNGDIAFTLRDQVHVPVAVPIDVHLRSADVIHSFWVPRVAGKLDMIPGRTNVLRIQVDEPGVYRGVCAEFCGLAHAHMQFELHAHEAEDFDDWLRERQEGSTSND